MRSRHVVFTLLFTGVLVLWFTIWSSRYHLYLLNPTQQNYRHRWDRKDGVHHISTGVLQMPVAGERNIFFIESSCAAGIPKRSIVSMKPRQACTLESAARTNPNTTIYYVDTCLNVRGLSKSYPAADQVVREVLRYSNVKVFAASIPDLMKDTPMESWFQKGALQRSTYPIEHSSDVIRLVTLWKYGGIYFDIDFIFIRSLEDLGLDFAVAERDNWVANGVLSFSASGLGHRVADRCLKELAANFDGSQWSSNGPAIITKVLSILCNTSLADEMTEERCWGFTVHRPALFYPYRYQSWWLIFAEDSSDAFMDFVLKNSTYGVHTWNKMSRIRRVQVDSKMPYALLAKRFCPKVFYAVGDTF